MTRARHTTTWDALRPLHPPLSREAERVLRDYYNSLGANIPDPEPIDRHVTNITRDVLTLYIRSNPYCTATQIRDATGYGRDTVSDALKALHHDGVVERHRGGHNAYTYTMVAS